MLCFVFSALVVILDQLFKKWITITMAVGEHKDVIPGIINLTHVENYGAAFSILSGKRWLLAAVMFIAIIIIVAILLRYTEGFWGTLGLAAVLGGAVGNLIDRVFAGHVVDMFEFKFIEFAIFNVADIFITLGGLTFLIFFIITSFKSSKTAEDEQEAINFSRGPASGASYGTNGYEYKEYEEKYDYDNEYDDNFDDFDEYEDEANTAEAPKPYLRPMPARDQDAYEETPLSPFAPVRTPAPVVEDDEIDEPEPAAPEPEAFMPEPPLSEVETADNTYQPQAEPQSLLEELGLLESDLEGADVFEGGDIDDLLREYGFEDEKTE